MNIFQQKWKKVGSKGQWNPNWSNMSLPLGMNDFNSQNKTHIIVLTCYL